MHHQTPSGTTIDKLDYTYDAAGRITAIASTRTGTDNYTYDKTNQLLSDGVNTYTWDANGNPKGSNYTIGAGNRVTSDAAWNYSYDAEGNLTSKTHKNTGETWQYYYDHRNRLTRAEHKSSSSGSVDKRVEFRYDVLGNRIEKSVDPDGDGPAGATVEKFAYDRRNAWADLDASGNITTRRLYLEALDALFARVGADGDEAWYLEDRLGSVRDLLDGDGILKSHIDYDGFGDIVSETDPSFGDRYKYTKREYDTETGLQYNRARYYDPQLRRWTSEDPLGFAAGDSNLYRYVHNNPVNSTDPTGLHESAAENIANAGIQAAELITGLPVGQHFFVTYSGDNKWQIAAAYRASADDGLRMMYDETPRIFREYGLDPEAVSRFLSTGLRTHRETHAWVTYGLRNRWFQSDYWVVRGNVMSFLIDSAVIIPTFFVGLRGGGGLQGRPGIQPRIGRPGLRLPNPRIARPGAVARPGRVRLHLLPGVCFAAGTMILTPDAAVEPRRHRESPKQSLHACSTPFTALASIVTSIFPITQATLSVLIGAGGWLWIRRGGRRRRPGLSNAKRLGPATTEGMEGV